MALLIMIFGWRPLSARRPTSSLTSTSGGQRRLQLHRPAARRHGGRIVTFYERALTTSVNDIEHIESQSIPDYGIIKIFFQPTVKH